jgi:Fe2+ or Zn2+ uptake regulation protein
VRDSVTILQEHGIQPSAQRVAVADYVLETVEHPSADVVWNRVKARVPYISRPRSTTRSTYSSRRGCCAR